MADNVAEHYAHEVWRLASGLADRGIRLLPQSPIDEAPVATALAELDRLRAALARAEQATTAARRTVASLETALRKGRCPCGGGDNIRACGHGDVRCDECECNCDEALAGYETREASAKPWAEVPENNRRLMTAVCAEILAADVPAAARRTDPTETGSESESPQVNARRTASDLPGMWETADLTGGQTDTAATRPSYRAFLGESPCFDPDCPCHPKHAPAAVVDPAGQTGGTA